MRCPNCNSRIENEAETCRYCGYDIVDKNKPTHDEQYKYSMKYSNTNDDLTVDRTGYYNYSDEYSKYNSLDSSKEKYIDAYIGKNKDIINYKFNIFSCIFGPFYLLYRNVNKIGIFVLLLYFLLIKEPFILLIINIFLGFEFKKLYYNDMNNKIEKILKNNQDKSNSEILELIKNSGDVSNSIKNLILAICFILLVSIMFFNRQDNIKNVLLEDSFNKLEYEVPNNYIKIVDNDFTKTYSCSSDEHNCIFSFYIKEYKYYNSERSYIRVVDKVVNVDKKKINNNIWYYYNKDNKEYYVIKKDNYFYKIIFSTYKDNDKYCSNSKREFINSLKFRGD